jgi:hypothetical protein
LRSKTGARGGNPERRGPTMALVVFSFARVGYLLQSALKHSLGLDRYLNRFSNVMHLVCQIRR